jgi:hypothetical protein
LLGADSPADSGADSLVPEGSGVLMLVDALFTIALEESGVVWSPLWTVSVSGPVVGSALDTALFAGALEGVLAACATTEPPRASAASAATPAMPF